LESDGETLFKNIMVDQFGTWPLFDKTIEINDELLLNTIAKYRKRGQKPLMDIYIASNPTNPSYSIIRVNKWQKYICIPKLTNKKLKS
jgi:hypothetical protein